MVFLRCPGDFLSAGVNKTWRSSELLKHLKAAAAESPTLTPTPELTAAPVSAAAELFTLFRLRAAAARRRFLCLCEDRLDGSPGSGPVQVSHRGTEGPRKDTNT